MGGQRGSERRDAGFVSVGVAIAFALFGLGYQGLVEVIRLAGPVHEQAVLVLDVAMSNETAVTSVYPEGWRDVWIRTSAEACAMSRVEDVGVFNEPNNPQLPAFEGEQIVFRPVPA